MQRPSIRIRAEEAAHSRREIEADLGLHLYLAQAGLCDFHGILGGPDLGFGCIDDGYGRVQGRGLSRAGRADDEDQAIGLFDAGFQYTGVALGKPQLIVGERSLARRQHAHDHILQLSGGGDCRYTQFNIEWSELLEIDLAVLGLAAL